MLLYVNFSSNSNITANILTLLGKESQKNNSKNKNKKLQSDSEEEDNGNRKVNNKKRRKKDILQESSLSEGSDESDSEREMLPVSIKGVSKRRKATHAEPDVNDPKFTAEVRINLPRFKCEKLPELYKSKKEIFEIKKLCKINLSRRARREMSENKKIKLTLSLRDKGKSTADSSDDEERSSTEENEDVAKSDEGLDVADKTALQSVDSMDNLAMSCLVSEK